MIVTGNGLTYWLYDVFAVPFDSDDDCGERGIAVYLQNDTKLEYLGIIFGEKITPNITIDDLLDKEIDVSFRSKYKMKRIKEIFALSGDIDDGYNQLNDDVELARRSVYLGWLKNSYWKVWYSDGTFFILDINGEHGLLKSSNISMIKHYIETKTENKSYFYM